VKEGMRSCGRAMARGVHVLYAFVVTIIHWNGRDLPEDLRKLPAGDYAIQAADELVALSPEEEEGLLVALSSLRAGNGVAHEEVRERVLRHVRR
jgi:hypothetical protein